MLTITLHDLRFRARQFEPPLVVADEPTAHLDHIQVEGVLTLVWGLATSGRLVLVSTHDDRLTQIPDRVIELVPHFSGADREPEAIALGAGADRVPPGGPSMPWRRARYRSTGFGPTAAGSPWRLLALGTTSASSGRCSTCLAAHRLGPARQLLSRRAHFEPSAGVSRLPPMRRRPPGSPIAPEPIGHTRPAGTSSTSRA